MHRLAAAIAVAIAGLLLPAASSATVTVGSPLTDIHSGVVSTGADAVYVQTTLPIAGFRSSSPVKGTVTRWRLRGASPTLNFNTFTLRVLRPAAGGTFTGAGSSEPPETIFNGFDDVLRTFDTAVPIHAGDQLGLGAVNGAAVPIGGPGGNVDIFNAFADGAPSGAAFASVPNTEVLVNADVEPTSAFALSPARARPKKGTAALTASLPNPGTLLVQGSKVKPQTLDSPAAGELAVVLAPTRAAKKRLRKKGKTAGPVSFTFTPSFGTAATQALPVKLKLKRPKR